MAEFHTHKDENGILVKCYHDTKLMLTTTGFWVSTIIAFPLEHFIWEKAPGFKQITALMGL